MAGNEGATLDSLYLDTHLAWGVVLLSILP